MSINVRCPGCSARRSLPEAFRGLEISCPKCGVRFLAEGSSTGSTDTLPILPQAAGEAAGSAEPLTKRPRAVSPAKVAPRAEPASGSQLPVTADLAFESDTSATLFRASSASSLPTGSAQSVSVRGQYKVLTRKSLWFTGEFNPEGFEEALNSYAQQGWRLKSTFVMTVRAGGQPSEELVVILER